MRFYQARSVAVDGIFTLENVLNSYIELRFIANRNC